MIQHKLKAKIMLKRIALSMYVLALSISTFADENLPYWRDLNVLSVNKQPARTAFMVYQSKDNAIDGNWENSKYYKSLNGEWKFFYSDDQSKESEDIEVLLKNVKDWGKIIVPGNWEVQGYGTAIYVNHPYEWQPRNPKPPLLPDATPIGIYYTEFTIPQDWDGHNVYLNMSGAKSGVYVYVNGKEVGYSEDSKNPAEFLLNPFLKDGENKLAVKMYRWSTGSYLECQDFFRLSGFERDVFLWAEPKVAIKDFHVVSTLDDTYKNGIFKVDITIKNDTEKATEANVICQLLGTDGHVVYNSEKAIKLAAGASSDINFSSDFANVSTWTAEHPNLYKLLLSVEQKKKVTEYIPFHVGFRKLEIKDSEYVIGGKKQPLFYVNGQPVKLKGVNLHEVSQKGGHYVSEKEMLKNFELMKQNNVNSIRTSHYPQDRRFYEMADKFGFYIYDEANIESHGMYYDLKKGGSLGNNPDWLENHLYRTKNMYERNKNYPSIIIWSLGNEAGNGYNFYQTYQWLKDKEKNGMNRPVNYERALWEWNTDMYVPQYPSAAWLEQIGKSGSDRPIVPSEYAHAMGNSTGDFYGQWNAINKYPHLQGGYIWEWIDHALLAKNKDGKDFWAYGGDFGKDMPSDGNFVADGLLGPDQKPHPGMNEVKYNMQNVGFTAKDLAKGKVDIKNRFYFTNLGDYEIGYNVKKNGEIVKEGILDINLDPQAEQTVQIPVSDLESQNGDEYFLNMYAKTKKEEPLMPKGSVIAYEQFQLPLISIKKAYEAPANLPNLEVKEDANKIVVSSLYVTFIVDKKEGIISSYNVNGVEYFDKGFGIQPNFWRAPNDNDYGNGAPHRLQVWKESSKNFNLESAKVSRSNRDVNVKLNYLLAAGNNYLVNYKITPSGIVSVNATFEALPTQMGDFSKVTEEMKTATFSPKAVAEAKAKNNVLEVPRIGVRFRMPANMDNVTYFGRGPEENYIDRKEGTKVDLYQSTAWDLYYPYVRPQENGHHTDTRWLALTKKDGSGLLIVGEDILEFNALRNSIEDFDSEEADAPYQWNNFSAAEIASRDDSKAKNHLRKQTHAVDIEPRDFVEVSLDWRQQGVAGYNSWGDRPIAEALIYSDETYNWSFVLVPINSKEELKEMALKKYN